MSKKHSGGSVVLGRNSPSPPPTALCFRQSTKIGSSSGNNASSSSSASNTDKNQKHRYHYHDPYNSVGLCGCHRLSKSRCVSAFGEYILFCTNHCFQLFCKIYFHFEVCLLCVMYFCSSNFPFVIFS